MAVKTRIVQIGNSRVIRIPKALLDRAQLPDEVELHAQPGRLIIRAGRRARAGWADAARIMRARGEDGLLDELLRTRFEEDKCKW